MSRLSRFIERYVEPSDWWGEALFGLIMVLIFTIGARSLIASGEDDASDVIVAVVGCNIGWGFISGGMFIIQVLFERGQKARLVREVHQATSEEEALDIIRDELDPDLEAAAPVEDRARFHRDVLAHVKKLNVPKTKLKWADMLGALVVFVLVVLTTIPAVIPFLLISDLQMALRVSNSLLVVMLFYVGFRWAGETNTNRWIAGVIVTLVGVAMSIVAEVLGG